MKRAALLWFGLALPVAGQDLTLNFVVPVETSQSRSEVPGSYALPLAVFDGATVPSRVVDGAVRQTAFRLDAPGMTVLALMAPLREQLLAQGFTLLLDCAAAECGGFDFRYGTQVMPEPDMHVDMGDYRFLSAERDTEAVSVLVSRSSLNGYVQFTQVNAGPVADQPPPDLVVIKVDPPMIQASEAVSPDLIATSTQLGAVLEADGHVALDDLVFDSGSATLEIKDYPSLKALAVWLRANSERQVALVGHTDASGGLAPNIALSKRRAEAVRRVLIDSYNLPAGQIEADGAGYLAPRASNLTLEGQQKNRRVEVILTSTR